MTTTETFLGVKKNQMATLSLMVHHEVQNYEDHKVSFKKDPKPYVLPRDDHNQFNNLCDCLSKD